MTTYVFQGLTCLYMHIPHGGEVSHDHVQGLDGFKGHAHLFSTKDLLQLVQIHLGDMFDANLEVQRGEDRERERE